MNAIFLRLAQLGTTVAMVLVVLSGISASAAGAQADEGGVGIALAEAPTDRADDPRALSAIVDHLQPGAVIERAVRIENSTVNQVTVELYAAASTISDGEWRPAPGRTANELASWTTVSPPRLTLNPKSSTIAAVTIRVPETVEDGERYATVWVEQPAAAASGIRVINRAGLRLYVSAGDGTEPPTDFEITAVRTGRTAEGLWIDADVENRGGRALDLSGDVSLSDAVRALTAGPFAGSRITVGLGQRMPVRFALPDAIADGTWTADIVVRSGTVERSRQLSLSFPTELDGVFAVGARAEEASAGETPTSLATAVRVEAAPDDFSTSPPGGSSIPVLPGALGFGLVLGLVAAMVVTAGGARESNPRLTP